MTEELQRWKRLWQDAGRSVGMPSPLKQARRAAVGFLIVCWGFVVGSVFIGIRLSTRIDHVASWIFFALLTTWLARVMYRATKREIATRRADEGNVETYLLEMHRRLQRDIVPPWRFWSLNLLCGVAMLLLPYELWRGGALPFTEPWKIAFTLAVSNILAVAVVLGQVRERRRTQRQFDSVVELIRELDE